MGRPPRRTNKLATALRRKDPQAVLKQLGEMLESARQVSLTNGAQAAEKERAVLLRAAEARPSLAARASRASAAAAGDIAFAKTVEETHATLPRPDPNGLTLAGLAQPGRTGGAPVRVVFTDEDGRQIEGAPEIEVPQGGAVSEVLNARDLARLREVVGEEGKARVAMKVGQRVISTTSRPLSLKPGAVLQFSLRRN